MRTGSLSLSGPIYSVPPNEWHAGTTTTFTISGAGFGRSPGLQISGTGISGYTNPCTSAPSASCDTQIVATVTLDANTPVGSDETITVTAGGLNPSGFLPVPIQGQSGQATAQAITLAFNPPVAQIIFNGSNVANNGTPGCPGSVACVYVGQKIALTAVVPNLPPDVTVQSYSWSMPQPSVSTWLRNLDFPVITDLQGAETRGFMVSNLKLNGVSDFRAEPAPQRPRQSAP